jgi:hypothetical protein
VGGVSNIKKQKLYLAIALDFLEVQVATADKNLREIKVQDTPRVGI